MGLYKRIKSMRKRLEPSQLAAGGSSHKGTVYGYRAQGFHIHNKKEPLKVPTAPLLGKYLNQNIKWKGIINDSYIAIINVTLHYI